MPDVLERINLNVPKDVRMRLRDLAKKSRRTESEVARTLLIDALERVRREDLFREVAATYTPEMRERDLAWVRALEQLRG